MHLDDHLIDMIIYNGGLSLGYVNKRCRSIFQRRINKIIEYLNNDVSRSIDEINFLPIGDVKILLCYMRKNKQINEDAIVKIGKYGIFSYDNDKLDIVVKTFGDKIFKNLSYYYIHQITSDNTLYNILNYFVTNKYNLIEKYSNKKHIKLTINEYRLILANIISIIIHINTNIDDEYDEQYLNLFDDLIMRISSIKLICNNYNNFLDNMFMTAIQIYSTKINDTKHNNILHQSVIKLLRN